MAYGNYVYILIVIFVVFILGLFAIFVLTCLGVRWCCLHGNKDKEAGFSLEGLDTITIETPEENAERAAENAFLDALPGLPPRYTYNDLYTATSGFKTKLGEGGSGEVYEGVLPGGIRVAVKRLQSASQGDKEFRTEVATIGNIHHINLVRLRGFCLAGVHRLLVYEFMVNGSLDQWLFLDDPNSLKFLDWKTRFGIATGTGRGLAYLHHDCEERIVHLDIKPQNILLDDEFHAKVSDFGLAKLMNRSESQAVTQMRGTPGYLAPEWLVLSAVTDKSDIYSYGMVLLEILSGHRNLNLEETELDKQYFPKWASKKLEEGNSVEEIVDPRLLPLETFDRDQADRMLRVAFMCIQEDMAARPSMPTILQMLEGVIQIPRLPPLPARIDALNTQFARILDLETTNSTLEFSDFQMLSSGPTSTTGSAFSMTEGNPLPGPR